MYLLEIKTNTCENGCEMLRVSLKIFNNLLWEKQPEKLENQ